MNDTDIRNNLIGMISDDYKCLYGNRPRGFKFDGMTTEQLQAWSNELSQAIHEQIAYEQAEEMMHEEAIRKAMTPHVWTIDDMLVP